MQTSIEYFAVSSIKRITRDFSKHDIKKKMFSVMKQIVMLNVIELQTLIQVNVSENVVLMYSFNYGLTICSLG